jgi:type IV pilus biogenesis/stability protein PilW
MSLIMDALKKAQQLRLKEFKGAPFFKHPHPKNKTSLAKRWMAIGAGFLCLLILLFVFWRPVSPPPITKPDRAVVLIKKKPPAPKAEKISQEPLKEVPGPSKDQPPSPPVEKTPPKIGPSGEEKGKEPLKKPSVDEKEAKKVKPQEKKIIVKRPTPTPPAFLKEEVPKRFFEMEHEIGKDKTLALDILTHFNLGVSYYNQREILKAIQAYQKVIEVDPTFIEAYNNLGVIYQEMGDFDKAFGAYQRSIEINPQYEKAHNNLGILLYFNGRYEEAMRAFQKALAINSNNIESNINLGILFKKQGQLDKAIESYQRALDINPFRGETHYNIGLLYEQLEKVELAIDHYQKFLQFSSRTYPGLASKVQSHLIHLTGAKGDKRR